MKDSEEKTIHETNASEMSLVGKRFTEARSLRIIIERVSTDICNTRENLTIIKNSVEEDTSIIQTDKQTTPEPFVIGNVELETSNNKKTNNDTSKVSIPKGSECVDIPQKNYNQDETEPKVKEGNEVGPRGRGRPRKDGQPKGRGRPRKEIIAKASECEGVRPKGRPKAITEKCLSDTRPSRLTREIKRRAPCYCCEREIAQRLEVSNFKRQRFTEVDTLGIETQCVSSDLGTTPENVTPQQAAVEEDTSITQASKQSTTDPFAMRNVQYENDTNNETIPKPNECKTLPLKIRVRKETIPKAGKLNEVRPRGRPRKEVLPKASECKEVKSKGRPSKETKQKFSECKGIRRRGRPRKDGKCKEVAPLIPISKKKKWKKRPNTNVNLRRKRLAKRLKYAEQMRDAKYRERLRLREKKMAEFKKEVQRLANLLNESDEKAKNVQRTVITNDCTDAPDIALQNLNTDKSTRASRKKIKRYYPDDYVQTKANPIKTSSRQCLKCGFFKSNHGIYCLACQRNPTEKSPTTAFPNKDSACGTLITESVKNVVNSSHDEHRENSIAPDIHEGSGGIGSVTITQETTVNNETSTPFLKCSGEYECGTGYENVSEKVPASGDDAMSPFLQSSNGAIIAVQIKPQPLLNYDTDCAQLFIKDETLFPQNSSNFISAHINIKKETESNDDEITSYMQCSNETIDAIEIKTEPPSNYDTGCAQLFIKDETQFPKNSSDLISAYIQIKKEPEANNHENTSYLQSSNESFEAIQIETEPPSNYNAVYAQIWNGDETMKALQNSSNLINGYIKVKTEPEWNDDARTSYLQISNETIDPIQIKTEPTLDFDACTSYLQS